MQSPTAGTKPRALLKELSFEGIGPYLAILVLLFVGTLMSPYFLLERNLLNIIRLAAINGIVSIGQTFVILAGGIDLSVGSVLGLCSTILAKTRDWGPLSFVFAVAAGGLVGLINGSLIIVLRPERSTSINSAFIVTLAALTAWRGTALVISQGHRLEGVDPGLRFLGSGSLGPIPMQIILFALIATVALLVLRGTSFGRSVYAVGANPTAALLSGIRANRITLLVFVISGLLAGFAGVVTATWLNVGDSAFHGQGAELDSIAAVAVGGAVLGGGKGTIAGTIAGVLIIGITYNLMNLAQIPGDVQYVVKGLIIVGAVALQKVRQ